METDESTVSREALVARAMDRALESERAAQVAIAEFERQAAEILEHARQQRRTILERAQARIVALHTRAAKNLERRTADIAAKRVQSATAVVGQLSEPARRTKALERLAARLTTDEAEAAGDDR
jgi:vacuolar-type H+-ATPase subunit H